MRRGCTAFAFLLATLVFQPNAAHAARIGSELQEHLAAPVAADSVSVILKLADRVDHPAFTHGRAAARGVITRLRERAARSQPALLAFLAARGYAGHTRSFWIDNSVAVRVAVEHVNELERRADLLAIELDELATALGAEGRPGLGTRVLDVPQGTSADPVWNLIHVGADRVWDEYGYDGSGVLFGVMDTGFDVGHPALAGKWLGGPHAWHDFVNGLPAPYDDHGHGTHSLGTVLGGDGPGPFSPDVGIAYGARFIGAKVLNLNFQASTSTLIAGAQWLLDPDGDPATDDFPDVIHNSWGINIPNYLGFYDAMAAWRAAGILPVFPIGNSGPFAFSTIPPGNYGNVIGVGATDMNDVVTTFSSRGPSPGFFANPPDRRKPDLVAPGDQVYSSLPGGGYGPWSGTSFASPHVSGTVALMLEARGGAMSYDEVRQILIETAVDRGAPGYDDNYGYGLLDAFAAVTRARQGAVSAPADPALRPSLSLVSPAYGRLVVRFELPDARDASLEIFDVAGRRLESRDVGALGAGPHTQELSRGLSPGMYWVRLCWADVRLSRKAVVLR